MGEEWRCFFPQYSAPFIHTPLYVSNSRIDMWGVLNIAQLGCVPTATNVSYAGQPPCDAAKWVALQGWWGAFGDAILPLLQRNPSMGAWAASCFVHEINVQYCSGQSLPNCKGWQKYTIAPPTGGAPLTLSLALPAWVSATLSNWESSAAAAIAAADAAPGEVRAWRARGAPAHGLWGGAAGALGAHQLVDDFTYPMNPSCTFPPG